MASRKINKYLLEVLGILLSFIILIPFYMTIVNSLKTTAEASIPTLKLPSEFRWDNYTEVIEKANIGLAFLNSATITFISVGLIILLGAPVAFVLQRNKSKLSKIILTLLLIGLMITPSIVPLVYVLNSLGLTGSKLGVILIYIGLFSPISVYLMHEYLKGLPTELDEAAIMDGCGPLRLFFQIIFPMMLPIIATISIFNFIMVWNDFMMPIYFLSGSNNITLPLTIYFFQGQYNSQWNFIFANVVIVTLPVLIVYLFAQRYIIAGMTSGAVKG
ncbi:carbohydrate ABC transporter permease [Metabacillus halosaccharovorans]|uniref:carbohydrate ABC transporter permease n=1 Tax=Metabacillus halosaccharovorans TaxID=930124 RepID=UPI001C2001C3|nr:carbohydrate ABC transporter permease [Metabacillus halosaccharovorans]MBU7591282.1 carbohydrate ABC transporter permease [Metabacillus halosaccharovorans]